MRKGLILLSRCWKPLRSGCLRVGAGSTLATWWLFSLAVTTWKIQEEEIPLDPYKLLQGHGQVIKWSERWFKHTYFILQKCSQVLWSSWDSRSFQLRGAVTSPSELTQSFFSLPLFSADISEHTLCNFSRTPEFVTPERSLFIQLN